MLQITLKTWALTVLLFCVMPKSYSQIENIYSALLLKPGHIYLSSGQLKLNTDNPPVVRNLSLEKNTRYAFSFWTEEEHKDSVCIDLLRESKSVFSQAARVYETGKGVRYFYFTPDESGLYIIRVHINSEFSGKDIYLIQGLFYTEPDMNLQHNDKRVEAFFCKRD